MERLLRFFFGPDVFISYSRREASLYAGSLAARLTGLSVYIDQLGSPPGANVPARVLAHARRSTALVVICSARALESSKVEEEIAVFPVERRPVVPVCFGPDPPTQGPGSWFGRLSGLAVHHEPAEALALGEPSESLVRRIRMAVGNQRQMRRIRNAGIAGVTVLALTAAGLAASVWQASREARRAQAAGLELAEKASQLRGTESQLTAAGAQLAVMQENLKTTEEANAVAGRQLDEAQVSLAETTREAQLQSRKAKAQAAATSGLWTLIEQDLQESYPQPDLSCAGPSLELVPPIRIYVLSDRTDVAPEARLILDRLADCFARLATKPVLDIAGHVSPFFRQSEGLATDELSRRTNEFALTVADREVSAVKDYLLSKGIPADRMRTISYGIERPFRGMPLLSNRVEISVKP